MTRPLKGWPTASLFWQLLALIGASLVAAQAISLILLFNLPPPAPDFYRASEITQALRGPPPNITDRRPLIVRISDEPPPMAIESNVTPKIRAQLAKSLGVPVDSVVISSASRFPVSDRRVFRVIRDRMARAGEEEEHFLIAPFDVAVAQPDGKWKVVRPERGIGLSPWQQRLVLVFILSTLAMAPAALVVARRLSAPIRLFTDAAERLGRDPGAPPLSPRSLKGSAEIAVAVRAFNEMQERLRRYVEDRTTMMGAIAHDLRTPLTRLRFRVEAAPEDARAKMVGDIDQMEEMISAALTFVRDTNRPGERTRLELSSLLESLCDEMAETGFDIEVERGEKVVLTGDPVALRRLFTNLLENAVKFGERARARVFTDGTNAVVEIEDDGPGIPPEETERVFDPFYRREPSRSRQTGGIGLGLAVVRSVARGHGGDAFLVNRPGGGLTARVQLPL
ncbi:MULTISPECIES: ATP-binding protein [Phenylobacterium]|uniref:histidine kinase n=1 Tax=Phenylobacterium koreense TaxID=266125 RepID=A0ABV2EL07_9CAUL